MVMYLIKRKLSFKHPIEVSASLSAIDRQNEAVHKIASPEWWFRNDLLRVFIILS
jgi:hypothetical protein